MSEPFFAEIRMFAFTFAPYQWAACNGQTMLISQNPPLYSLIGTKFGGDGQTTFRLPNFQGAVPVGVGAGPGLTPRNMADSGGATQTTLTYNQMPVHDHNAVVTRTPLGTTSTPSNTVLPSAENSPAVSCYDLATTDPLNTTFAAQTLSQQGGGQPHENRQPFQAVGFCICLEGYYPTFP